MNALDGSGMAFGCLFCETGREQELCNLIEYKCPDVEVYSAKCMKHKTFHGVHSREPKVFIPGYVFFRCVDDLHKPDEFPRDRIFKVLRTELGDWRLMGRDYDFTAMLFRYHGILDFSKAYLDETGWVHFLSGPLKDMGEHVVKVDKRGRAGKVQIDFAGKIFGAWLGFDLVDPPEGAGEEKRDADEAAGSAGGA